MLNLCQALLPALRLQRVGSGVPGLSAGERVADPNDDGEIVDRHVGEVKTLLMQEAARFQREKQELHTGEESEAQRDSKGELSP